MAQRGLFQSRSRLVQKANAEKLQQMRRVLLASECAKLDPAAERREAEEHLSSEARWPEY